MNKLSRTKQAQVIAALVEGNSIRAIERMTGTAKHTILKLIKDVGIAAADYQDHTLVNLKCKRIQVDEIWQFCYAKEKNVPAEKKGQFGYGDVWTWVATTCIIIFAGFTKRFAAPPRWNLKSLITSGQSKKCLIRLA